MPASVARARGAAAKTRKRKAVGAPAAGRAKLVSKAMLGSRRLSSKVPLPSLAAVDPLSVGVDPKMLREYEAAQHQMIKRGFMPGCASVVLRHGKVVHNFTAGYADIEAKQPFRMDTLCRLVCMTKSYVATAFMTLVEQGFASLEDRLDKYLPAFGHPQVLKEGAKKAVKARRPILLKDVISHCSGLGYPPDLGEEVEGEVSVAYKKLQTAVQQGSIATLKTFVERLAKVPLLHHPGECYEYGFSMDVLARVVEVIMGKDIEECLQERVFRPLGMRSTLWSVRRGNDLNRLAALYGGPTTWGNLYGADKKQVPIASRSGLLRIDGKRPEDSNWRHGRHCRLKSGGGFMGYLHGGLVSSVEDTVAFVMMMVNRGIAPSGERLLRERTLAIMEKNRLKKSWGSGAACYMGNIGVFREGGKEFGMGGAACTYWSVDRKDGVATVWFTQNMDMPEFDEVKGLNARRADLWKTMYDAVRSKAAKRFTKRRKSAGKLDRRPASRKRSSSQAASASARRRSSSKRARVA